MKNYYVIVGKDDCKVVKATENECIHALYPNSYLIRGFYSKKKADEYAARRKQKQKKDIFVVLVGKNPGIYYSIEEMREQVAGVEGAIVKKAFSEIDAQKILSKKETFITKKQKVKMSPEEKLKEKRKYLKSLNLKINGEQICFVDCEANDGKVISLGAVILDTTKMEIVNSFYSVSCYNGFKHLTSYVQDLTKLTNEEVLSAPSFNDVFSNFMVFLKQNNVTDIFSWSNSDARFLKDTDKCTYDLAQKIVNIQPYVSAVTADYLCKSNWGLNSMLKLYGFNKDIEHNALSDANDLCNVFVSWKTKTPDFSTLKKD